MEKKFLAHCAANREQAGRLGIRIRPLEDMEQVHRSLSGSRTSDGFGALAQRKRLELSLEALVVDRRYTGLFSDAEANTALDRLLAAGYPFY